jgi:trimeric autotransporter adhesin
MFTKFQNKLLVVAQLISLLFFTGFMGESLFAQVKTAFTPSYFPVNERAYGFRTYKQTYGGQGEYTTKIPDKLTVPYTTGSVTGIYYYDPIEDDEFAFYNNGIAIQMLADKAGSGEVRYYAGDCSLSAPSPALSFGNVSDGMIVQGMVYGVDSNSLACSGGDLAVTLVKISDVRVQAGLYPNSVVSWEVENDRAFVPLNFHGKESALGITLPTNSETGGRGIQSFTIFGYQSGMIAAGHINSSSGELDSLWELASINYGASVTTVVGKTQAVIDGGSALSAPLFSPAGSAIDAQGNLFFADMLDYRVWKVDPSGIITCIAGNGRVGFSGDGGLACSAQLNNPVAVAIDNSGNIYISDSGNHRIRKVDPDGIISTYAGTGTPGYGGDGGQATAANLNEARSLAVFGGNALLIVDGNNNRIRKIDANGVISTIAGTGTAGYNGDNIAATSAQLNSPTTIAVGQDNTIYIVDASNARIRYIQQNGLINTFAGNGESGPVGDGDGGSAKSARLRGPGTVAVDRSGNVYIGEQDRIRRISGGIINTVVGGGSDFLADSIPATQAGLGPSRGLAVDATGNIYISEYTSRIRKAVVGGLITTVAGGMNRFCGDGGPATSACIFGPHGIAWDSQGNLFVADTYNMRVRKVTPNGIASTFVSYPQIWLPTGLVFDKSGNLLIADGAMRTIWKATPAGIVSAFAGGGNQRPGDNGPATSAQVELGFDIELAFDINNNLYFTQSSHGAHVISKVTPAGIITTFAGVFGSNGYSGDSGPATAALLNTPEGLAFDSVGNLYFSDSGNNRIRKITPAGIISTVAGNGSSGFSGDGGPALQASMNYPTSLAFDPDGSLIIADQQNNRIRKLMANGNITTLAGTGGQGFNGDGLSPVVTELALPASVSFSPDGNLFISDSFNHRIRMIAGSPILANLTLTAGSSKTAGTTGIDVTTQAGYSKVDINSGAAPYGTAVFSFKQDGVTVSKVGVPASPPTTLARVFIDYRSGVHAVPSRSDAGVVDINTGIAAVNYGTAAANVTFTLRNASGSAITTGHRAIAAGAHFSCFIDQLKDIASDFDLPANFQTAVQFGILDISSDQPLSVLALRGTYNQRRQFIVTTTPVADLTQSPSSSPMYFAQFADGGGYTTSLFLMNTSTANETGVFEIKDDSGNALAVHQAEGTSGSSFPYSIPPNGIFHFQTDGAPANWEVGWMKLTPDSGTSTPVGAGVYGYNSVNVLVTESGVPSASPTMHARIYLDRSGNHDTGLAIANIGNATANIMIGAYQTDGVTAAGTSNGPLPLVPYGHGSRFAEQLITGLPAGFTGLLDISSTTPFAALTVRSLINENNDYLMTTFPVADMNQAAPSPIVFPQIADGGGYATQFILLGAGEASSATIHYYNNDGAPLAVGK